MPRCPQRFKSMSKVRSVAPTLDIHVTGSAGPSELKLQISITTDKTVLELKHAIAEKSDVEADRQRLIYSGAISRLFCVYFSLCATSV
jgi:hypothetical protein